MPPADFGTIIAGGGAGDAWRLVARIVELARDHSRYGYRRITALLRREGWRFNVERVERIWRQEYNTFRPRSALGYPPPAPVAVQCSIQTAIGLPFTATVGLTWTADQTGNGSRCGLEVPIGGSSTCPTRQGCRK